MCAKDAVKTINTSFERPTRYTGAPAPILSAYLPFFRYLATRLQSRCSILNCLLSEALHAVSGPLLELTLLETVIPPWLSGTPISYRLSYLNTKTTRDVPVASRDVLHWHGVLGTAKGGIFDTSRHSDNISRDRADTTPSGVSYLSRDLTSVRREAACGSIR